MSERVTQRVVERATENLRGILAGITADYTITDAEVAALAGWLEANQHLLRTYPFAELQQKLDLVLEDHVIDADEREDLLDWCQTFTEADSPFKRSVTTAIQNLHGFLHGIAIDGAVTAQEARDLHDWLENYRLFQEFWPFTEVCDLVTQVLADGDISEQELVYVKTLCEEFKGEPVSSTDTAIARASIVNPFLANPAPIVHSIAYICDEVPNMSFDGRHFCFTGNCRYGKRKALWALVEERGGKVSDRVHRELHYLVIGALSQPVWTYSVYGRKVEQAKDLRGMGFEISIVSENDFLRACGV